jgi:COP9 signalosome complex subunit 6
VPLHKSFLHYNESAVLLAFHPDQAAEGGSSGGKLPVTVYESMYEASTGSTDKDASDVEAPSMGLDGPAITFRELPYAIETEETERIGVEFVAKGGGNATATEATETADAQPETKSRSRGRPSKAKEARRPSLDETAYLSPEDEERTSLCRPLICPDY